VIECEAIDHLSDSSFQRALSAFIAALQRVAPNSSGVALSQLRAASMQSAPELEYILHI